MFRSCNHHQAENILLSRTTQLTTIVTLRRRIKPTSSDLSRATGCKHPRLRTIWHFIRKGRTHHKDCYENLKSYTFLYLAWLWSGHLLRHYATSQKVVDSIPVEVLAIFNWPNPCSLTVAQSWLYLWQEQVPRIFLGVRGMTCKADNLTSICKRIV
jgi:hypothetical protein